MFFLFFLFQTLPSSLNRLTDLSIKSYKQYLLVHIEARFCKCGPSTYFLKKLPFELTCYFLITIICRGLISKFEFKVQTNTSRQTIKRKNHQNNFRVCDGYELKARRCFKLHFFLTMSRLNRLSDFNKSSSKNINVCKRE